MLVASGLLGSPSAAAAVVAQRPPPREPPRLRNGDTGSCVRVLQRLLVSRGYSVGPTGADGQFGHRTELAVRRSSPLPVPEDRRAQQSGHLEGSGHRGRTRYSIEKGPNRTNRVTLSFDGCPLTKRAFTTMVAAAEQRGIAFGLLPDGQLPAAGTLRRRLRPRPRSLRLQSLDRPPGLHNDQLRGDPEATRRPGVVTTYGRPPFGAINATVQGRLRCQGHADLDVEQGHHRLARPQAAGRGGQVRDHPGGRAASPS